MFNAKIHRFFYIFFMSGLAFSLPVSIFMTSVFTIALSVNWLLDFSTYRRMGKLFSHTALQAFLMIFAIYLIFLLNTENIDRGLEVLRLRLPLLAIPLVVAGSDSVTKSELRIVLSAFLGGVLFASIAGSLNFFMLNEGLSDRREISLFISHIRLSLMVCLAIIISGWYTVIYDGSDFRLKYIYAGLVIWFGIFLLVLLSLSGIVIFTILVYFTVWWLARHSLIKIKVSWLILAGFLVFMSLVAFPLNETLQFYHVKDKAQVDLSRLTASGREYQHLPGHQHLENGHFVWRYICEAELRKEWNSLSVLEYDGSDLKGQELRVTLIRYLSSMGLTKDSLSIRKLERSDIEMIESGVANYRFKDGTSIKDRVYEIIWQVDRYLKGGNPQGHSITQRLEFIKTALGVFHRYPLFGTGSGDLHDEFRYQYNIDNSRLGQEFRYISHNQYITIMVSAGITGLLIFLFALFYPPLKMRASGNYLFMSFFIIVLLSMLNEDTLETSTGICFFAFFYSLFLFSNGEGRKE